MLFAYKEKNIRFTQDYKDAVEKKIGKKFEKYFKEDTTAHVTLTGEGETMKFEITIPLQGGGIIRAERSSSSVHEAIDQARDAVEKQLMKHRKKLIDRYQGKGAFAPTYVEEPEENYDEEEIRIVKTKRFAVKPMDPEEACLQMEMLGHDFFVFRNSETNEINVVYKRKGNTYGIIDPNDDED